MRAGAIGGAISSRSWWRAVPEESNAYEMTPGGLRKLPHLAGRAECE